MRKFAGMSFICAFVTHVLACDLPVAQNDSEETDVMFKQILSKFPKELPKNKKKQPSLADLQAEVIGGIVADRTDLHDFERGDREWVYIAVNHELIVETGARSSTQTAILARKPGRAIEGLSFRLSMATKQKIGALQEAMTRLEEKPWTIVDISIERDGRYDFAFGYGPPPRINGDLLYSPLTGLLDRYRAKTRTE